MFVICYNESIIFIKKEKHEKFKPLYGMWKGKEMGNLQYAILGLLNRKDMTGYDLSKEFQSDLSEFWSAKHSQIYPELKSLTEDGSISYQVEIAGNVMEKKLYSITEKGREKFARWEEQYHEIGMMPKDEFRLRLFFSDSLPEAKRIELLESRFAQHRSRLEYLEEKMSKFSVIPPEKAEEFSDYLVLLGGIMREEANCNWIESCIKLCCKMG